MSSFDFAVALRKLRISPKVAAHLLDVDPKTMSRWLSGAVQVPGPAREAVRAWQRLDVAKIPWRPDGLPLTFMTEEEIAEQIRLTAQHILDLDRVIEKVKARGGPAAPWKVNLEAREATLGDAMQLYFYPLGNGGFSPSSYSRTDQPANYERDLSLIEDAIVCIAKATAASPGWHNRR